MRKKLAWLLSVALFLSAAGRLEAYFSDGRYVYAENNDAALQGISNSAGTTAFVDIAEAADIMAIKNNPAGYYRLVQDIDCSGLADKIGDSIAGQTESYLSIAFSGKIDGNGHTLSGLQRGLFDRVEKDAVISDLTMQADFSGSVWLDGAEVYPDIKYTIAGSNLGRIENCNIALTLTDLEGITAECLYVYGLCVENAGVITDCDVRMTIGDILALQTEAVLTEAVQMQKETVQMQTVQVQQTQSTQAENALIGMYVAGIAGDNCQDIQNCHVTLQVYKEYAEQMYVGGICLQNSFREALRENPESNMQTTTTGTQTTTAVTQATMDNAQTPKVGTISGCQTAGEVRSWEQGCMDFGGIAVVNEGVITNSENRMDAVLRTVYSGGIAAQNRNRITGCRNLGTLTVTGGLEEFNCRVGEVAGQSEGTVSSCEEKGIVEYGENGQQGVLLPKNCPLPGDVDGDREITMRDVVLLRRFLSGEEGAVQQRDMCDTDGDGSVTSADVVILLRYLAGY